MEGVTKKEGALPGKTVAVFCGVHGNERVGVNAVREAAKNLSIARGTLYLVEANPPAIEANVRAVGKNLNRCFLKDNSSDTPEDVRARELMTLLDKCDALLDIHSSNSEDAVPFAICERNALPIATTLPFSIISFGWDAIEPGGADGYMYQSGKIGICIECGSSFNADAHQHLAEESIRVFLQHFDMLPSTKQMAKVSHRYIQVHTMGIKHTEDFSFAKIYKDFEALPSGKIFATDGNTTYTAGESDCIIFPRPNTAIGDEAFILGRDIPPPEI